MTRLQIATVGGYLTVGTFNEWLDSIKINSTENDSVMVAKATKATAPFSTISEMDYPTSASIQAHNYKLKPFYDFLFNPNNSDIIKNQTKDFLIHRFINFLVKKKEEFYIKDLDINSINELSMKYMSQGHHDGFAFHFDLSKYQRFFVLVSEEAFQVFIHQSLTDLSGELVEMRPDGWVMGRYENLKYRDEMLENQRYIG